MERHIFSKLLNREDDEYPAKTAIDTIRRGIDKLSPMVDDKDKEKLEDFDHWLTELMK